LSTSLLFCFSCIVIVVVAAAKLGDLFDPIAAACIERKGVGADLLNSDADKNDYDW
jgi:hypothetical protein